MGKKYDKECKGGDDCNEAKHLCKISRRCGPDQLRAIIRDARFFCSKCGRAAHEAGSLCKPLEIYLTVQN